MPTDTILARLADPCTTYWLRDALKTSLARDPLDALNDAEALASMLRERLADLTAHAAR